MPLEPRIMMDATLDLGLGDYFSSIGDDAAATASLLKLASELQSKMNAFAGELTDGLGDAMGGAADLFVNEDHNPYVNKEGSALEDTFSSLRTLGTTLTDTLIGTDLYNSISGALDNVRATIHGEIFTFASSDLTGLTEDQKDQLEAVVADALKGLDLSVLFDARATLESVIESMNDTASSFFIDPSAPPSGVAPDPLIGSARLTQIVDDLNSALLGYVADELSDPDLPADIAVLDLVDVLVDGKTVIGFTQVLDGANQPTNAVNVTVALGQLLPDFDALFETFGLSGDTFAGFADYLASLGDATLSFVLDATATASSGGNYDAVIAFTDFETDFSFGGEIEASFLAGLDFSAGLFNAGITAIELAGFSLDFTGSSLSLDFSTSDLEITSDIGAGDFFSVLIADAGALNDPPVLFDPGASHTFAVIDFGAVIDWATGFIDGADSIEIAGRFALAGNIQDAGGDVVNNLGLDVSATVKAFDASDVELSGVDWSLAQIRDTVLGLIRLDGTSFVNGLASAASALDIVFSSKLFDIDIPFLDDFNLSSVASVYQTISDLLLKPLSVDISILGFSGGNDTSENGSLVIDGIIADKTDGTVFKGETTISFDVVTVQGTTSTTHAVSIAVPLGGFVSTKAFADAMKVAFAAIPAGASVTLADLIGINEVRGEIELRTSTLTGFSLAGVAMSLFGITARNDTASFDEPLRGASIGPLIGTGWMSLFQLNLNVEQTITYDDADESSETVAYRTLTLSPPVGGWTVNALSSQLNELFAAAGIALDVTVESGGLVLTVDQDAFGSNVKDVAFSFAIDTSGASVASSIGTLQAFVNDALHDVLPDVSLVLDFEKGDIALSVPEIAFGYMTEFDFDFATELGALAELSLEAEMGLSALFALGFDIGVSLFDLLSASAGQTVADFIWLDNAALAVTVEALADEIEGSGRLGIVEVGVGGGGVNKVEIGARLDAGLVGYDADTGEYSTRLTFAEIMDKANSLAGIIDLVGTFALTGTATGGAFVYVELNDIEVEFTGINIGIESTAVDSFTASLNDVLAPTDWAFTVDSAVVSLITGLGTNDFIDTLYNSLMLVDQLLNGLSEDLAFLNVDIPVLGINVLDAMHFAKELAGELQAFKNSPNDGLADISSALSLAFGLGEDDLKLVWDGAESVFYVSLGMSFLDGPLTYDFSLDLARLLGDLAGDDDVANLLSIVSTISNVTGEGRIVLDAALGFDLTFGLDLSGVLGANTEAVTTATALAALAGVSQLAYNTTASGHQGRDVMISVARTTGGEPAYTDIKIELDDAVTVGDALQTIYVALDGKGLDIVVHGKDASDAPVTIVVGDTNWGDIETLTAIENVEFADTLVQPTSFAGLEALFGLTEPTESSGAPAAITGSADLGSGFDAGASYSFAVVVNGAQPVEVVVAAETERDLDGFITALNTALAETSISRADIGLGLPANLNLGKLLVAELEGGSLRLAATNFAVTVGADPITFSVTGIDTGETATVSVVDLGGSNLARALGFAMQGGDAASGTLRVAGSALEARADASDGVRAFIVTDDIDVGGRALAGTGVYFEFLAGIPDGLNMSLSLGPLSVAVINGTAVIGGDGGGNAFVRFGVDDAADAYLDPNPNDAVDYADDGRLYFDAVVDAFTGSDDVAVADLFAFDADVALNLVLPLEDSLGLLDMAGGAGITIKGNLLTATGNFTSATGALPAILDPVLSVADYLTVDIDLPDFSDILANINPYAILNDPILLTNGLSMILTSIDKTLRSVIRGMDLPIVGDAMTQGLNVFNDIANSILQPIMVAANTPNADGSMPTTIDLLERVVNDALRSLFGITDPGLDVIRAVLTEDVDNPSIVAEIFLTDFTIFEAALDVGFDLGIPGLNLEVGQSSELVFEVIANLNIAFGIDRMGFFFLNDTDNAEIVLEALVRTNEYFTASASLGLVGLALTTNRIDTDTFGDDIYGAVIGGAIAIDLFTDLGTAIDYARFDAEVATYGRDGGYENIVRLGELTSGKSTTGAGTKLVSLSGEFAVQVDMHLTTSIVNPSTGGAITELPSALADFVFSATYEIGGELNIEILEFQDVGLYAGDFLVQNVLPVVQEIYKYVEPIADAVQFLKDTGIGGYTLYDLIYEAVRFINPAALFVFDALDTLTEVIDFIGDIAEGGGTIYFGTFSLLSPASATGVVDTSDSKAVSNLRAGMNSTSSSSLVLSGAISNSKPGIAFHFPIFTDPSNVLNIITGNLAGVELFEVDLTLLDFTLNIDLVAALKSAVSFIPSKVFNALFGGVTAKFYVHAEAGITVGYDLYGIAQFLGSGEAIDILDGMYFDADRPLLELSASFNVGVGINFAVIKAGLNLSGYFDLVVGINDPNMDGKLRFGEIIWAADPANTDGLSVLSLLKGHIKLGLSLGVYFKLDLFLFSIGGSWNWTLLDITINYGYDFAAHPNFLETVGGVTTLNVGATANKQIGGDAVDGDDDIYFSGNTVYINGKNAGTVGDTVLIYAGQGNNTIDLSGLSANISFQVFTGDGDDLIIVGNGASGVISAGGGNNRILSAEAAQAMGLMALGFVGPALSPTAPAPVPSGTPGIPSSTAPTSYGAATKNGSPPTTGNQTLLVLGSGGDHIDLSDSTADIVVVATALDIEHDGQRVELSEWVQAEFLGLTPDMAAVLAKIDAAMPTYTAVGQTRADSGDTYIHTGTGNDVIFAGNGNDTILTEGGNNIIFAGGGDDRVTLNGNDGNWNWVEGGAGADVILGGAGDDVLMGWGRFDRTTTADEFVTALPGMSAAERSDFAELVRTSVTDDDGDWIDGGAGNDIIIGNGGARNVLIGGIGNDIILAGTGDDILAGGSITLTPAGGTPLSPSAGFNPVGNFTIAAVLGDDGDDELYGDNGNDVLIGGGGNDRLEGGGGSNVLIGDFADVVMGGTSKVLSVASTGIDSADQGDDILIGGALADVMVGGGGKDVLSGGNGRNVIIGDNARLASTNLFEGVKTLVSFLGAEDDADTIYSGVVSSIIVAGGSKDKANGDFISTGNLFGVDPDTAAQGMIIFADYGDIEGALFAPRVLTSVFDARDGGISDVGDDDVINIAGTADDIVFGGAGNDTISSGGGSDIIFGDTGTYTRTQESAGATIELTTDADALDNPQAGQTGTPTGNDTIHAGDGDNVVFGGMGDDQIATGEGDDIVFGDNGLVRLGVTASGYQRLYAEGRDTAFGGDDLIWSNGGDDLVIAGFGSDSIDAGTGNDLVAGDWITYDFEDGLLTAQATDVGGDDWIDGGDGNDILVGGYGKDTIYGRAGADLVIGDHADIDLAARTITSTATDDGDDDYVEGNDGDDIIVGGLGDDEIHGNDGADVIAGDYVDIDLAAGTLVANAPHIGGEDRIRGGNGDDIIVGGLAGDEIDGDAGNDLIVGDWARIDWTQGTLASEASEHGGDDLIAGGDGDDIVIGGWGADTVSGGGNANVVIGDYASLTWSGRFDLKTLVLDAIDSFGDDLIYINYDPDFGSGSNPDGNSIGVGGRGDDVMHGGAANDLLLGDWGIFSFLPPEQHPGKSAFDRIVFVESTENWAFGRDYLYGHDGRDILIGGDGDDNIKGGADQDLIAGDAAVYLNYHDGWELLETRFPFDGGDDVLDGEGGNDIVIAGYFNFGTPGAGDLIYGNTIEDFLMGDSGSILIFNHKVIRFNYLGLAPADLISTNQLGNSAGVLMRPAKYYPGAVYGPPVGQHGEQQLWTLPHHYVLDADTDTDTGKVRDFWHLDTAVRHVMLSEDTLRLIDLLRSGAVAAEDVEEEIREAILAILADRYGHSIPAWLLALFDRYVELLMAQIAGTAEDETAAGPDEVEADAGGAGEAVRATQSGT